MAKKKKDTEPFKEAETKGRPRKTGDKLAPEWEQEKLKSSILEDAVSLDEEDKMDPVAATTEDNSIGRFGPIGKEEIDEAYRTFTDYKAGKQQLENRIIENERWYKRRHWEMIDEAGTSSASEYDPKPTSAWLFNSLANKHADVMDNYPQPNILPREQGDQQEATKLSQIIPVVLDRNKFKRTYSEVWWYKLKHGTGVYATLWDPKMDNGIGDVTIKEIDLLNIFWEPGIKDIQQSRNIFTISLVDSDLLVDKYDFLEGKVGGAVKDVAQYVTDDYIDNQNKTEVFNWYYKKTTEDGRDQLHFVKFAAGEILYASENDPDKSETGWYQHSKYPFEFDVLFPIEGSPCGFGYIDIMKDPQMYIDKLNQIIIKNALMAGKKRYFKKKDSSINVDDFADWSKDFVEVTGSMDEEHIREIKVDSLPAFIASYMQQKIDELKETSGNRDFSQGSTNSGVTAASAIAALQEAGGKLSRDMITSSYDSFENICYFVLENIRQFYDESRFFRILGDNGHEEFIDYDNRAIRIAETQNPMTGDMDSRMPIFDIKITAQKQSPFSRISQNELAKELYRLGLFNPQMADQSMIVLDMMEFEGKEAIKDKIQDNQQLLQMVNALQQKLVEIANVVDNTTGSQIGASLAAEGLIPQPQGAPGRSPAEEGGEGVEPKTDNTLMQRYRQAAATTGTPKL